LGDATGDALKTYHIFIKMDRNTGQGFMTRKMWMIFVLELMDY
jgi:hypothetical protein